MCWKVAICEILQYTSRDWERGKRLLVLLYLQTMKGTAEKRQALSEVEARHMEISQLEADIRVCYIPHSSSKRNPNSVWIMVCVFPIRNCKICSKTQPTSLKSR